MPRKAISPAAYVEAWKTQHYETIHKAALAEASRQVNEMVKWMEHQIQFDPDEMKVIHLEAGVFDLIKKARNYRSTIYNRNKAIAVAGFDALKAHHTGDAKELSVITEKMAEYEDDQWVSARRILKIYIYVKAKANGSLQLLDPETVGYEYDPEETS